MRKSKMCKNCIRVTFKMQHAMKKDTRLLLNHFTESLIKAHSRSDHYAICFLSWFKKRVAAFPGLQ